jgi:hypothetical protein
MAEPLALERAVTLPVGLEFGSRGAIEQAVEEGVGHIVHLRRRRLPSAVSGFVGFLRTGQWKPASSSD